ncbi:cytochrome c oxidase assembly protein [Sphaerisporangium sp. TRM90804]|uniref:cytochrome c oxidase assembly protein n=1 Tax=Sphaerisporangium sp. TRM90804 TaxID=3031113 RepID=UPI00244CC26F|nr:cytochrome c oxidase assembly protein [Sphaerisporangium sp. TRM90804]MDH2424898.1 cytochrome c oxidase assembly protein [Sphaerisporangium sp. TRM90804]
MPGTGVVTVTAAPPVAEMIIAPARPPGPELIAPPAHLAGPEIVAAPVAPPETGVWATSVPPAVHDHGGAGAAATVVILVALAVPAAGYVVLAARRRREPRGWSHARTASFVTGILLLAAALLPPVASLAAHDFRGHMLQHLLAGMLAPLGLVLGAPITLALRSASPRGRRVAAAVLRGRAAHVLANPWLALALSAGGLVVLYLTPLYRVASADPMAHHLVHAHFLLAGCLFTWVIAGPDPAPRRPSVPRRLVVLGVAVAVHASLSQLMYAGLLVDVPVPGEQLRGAATIMYYGGDVAELLLAFALVATWRPARRARALSRRPGESPA